MEKSSINDSKFIVFTINGGAGKNIIATSVVNALNQKYPDRKIIILTAWAEVWLNNSNIFRVYTFNNAPYFYKDFIESKDVKIFNLEPYSAESHILKQKHISETWLELVGIGSEATNILTENPRIVLNHREIESVKNKVIGNDKVMLIQTNGGADSNNKHSWMRDMPLETALAIVNRYSSQMRIIHVRRDDQLALPNTEQFKGSLRELFALIHLSNKRVFIDSVCQHASMALNRKSTILWVKNKPEIFGWELHDNFAPDFSKEDELPVFNNSLFEEYDITGNIFQCPYPPNSNLFELEQIFDSIDSQPTYF